MTVVNTPIVSNIGITIAITMEVLRPETESDSVLSDIDVLTFPLLVYVVCNVKFPIKPTVMK
jgi:hypothetical protein